MKRIFKCLVIFIFIISLSGCTKYKYDVNSVNYNLNIGTSFDESIVFTLPFNIFDVVEKEKDYTSTSLEYELINLDINPVSYLDSVKYKKKINKSKKKVEVVLDYNYLESEYVYSRFLSECFENYNLVSTDKYFYAKLDGEYYCWSGRDVNINVSTDFNVLESNGKNISGNNYFWYIDKNNYKDVNINFKVARKYNNQLKKHKTVNAYGYFVSCLKLVFVIVLIAICGFFGYRAYKNQEM